MKLKEGEVNVGQVYCSTALLDGGNDFKEK